jgi:hypothetical protein
MRDSEFMGAGIGRADGGDLLRVLAGVSDDPLGLPSGVADYGLGFAQSLSRLGANDSGLHTGLSEDFLRMHAGFSGGTHLFPRLLEQLTGLGFLPRVLHAGDDFANHRLRDVISPDHHLQGGHLAIPGSVERIAETLLDIGVGDLPYGLVDEVENVTWLIVVRLARGRVEVRVSHVLPPHRGYAWSWYRAVV